MKITNSTVAVITGAATGIGAELARTLVNRGARVVAGDMNVAGLETLQRELGSDHCVILKTDVSKHEDIKALIDLAKSVGAARLKFHGFDLMFNNAAAGQVGNFLVGSSQSSLVPAPFGDDVFSITSRLLNVNIGGVAAGYRLAAEEFMRDKRPGIIVTTASMGGFYPGAYQATYGATKAAVVSFVKAVNPLLKMNGIRSTAICPGWLISSVHGTRDLDAYLSLYEESKRTGVPLVPGFAPTPEAFRKNVNSTTEARVVEAMLLFVEDDSVESDTISVIGNNPFGTVETTHTIKPLMRKL